MYPTLTLTAALALLSNILVNSLFTASANDVLLFVLYYEELLPFLCCVGIGVQRRRRAEPVQLADLTVLATGYFKILTPKLNCR
uniref:Secreted protein n=1 Tax=Globodera rostochiensis TaxID=31243 RepID=A0A914H963_GLORO